MGAIQSPPTTASPTQAVGSKRPRQEDIRWASRPAKLPRPSHPEFPPPRFWDELSRVPLARRSLQELDRRNELSRKDSQGCGPRQAQEISQDNPSIKHFARHGGPDLTILRGYRAPSVDEEMSASQSSSRGRKRSSQSSSRKQNTQSKTPTTKNTGPYDGIFGQHLIDNNIFFNYYEYPDGSLPPEPDNIEEIRQALSRRRESLSPSRISNDDFRKFNRAEANAASEREVTSRVIPLISGNVEGSKTVAGEFSFTNLQPLTNGKLVSGNPDLFYGARPEELDQRVRQRLDGFIVPSKQADRPIVPNFCLAVKGLGGTMEVAIRQACYDGTLAARAVFKLQEFGKSGSNPDSESLYDNKAYTLTSIYHAGMLRVYTIHPIKTPTGKSGYTMTYVQAFALIGDYESYIKGLAAFRNGRDWAKEQRDGVIKRANEKAHLLTESAESHASPLSLDSNTSADELVQEFRPRNKRSKP